MSSPKRVALSGNHWASTTPDEWFPALRRFAPSAGMTSVVVALFVEGLSFHAPACSDQLWVVVFPVRIGFLDQCDLPVAAPALDAFLAQDGVVDVAVLFEPNEDVHAVLAGESGQPLFAMIVCPEDEVVGDAGVERSVWA